MRQRNEKKYRQKLSVEHQLCVELSRKLCWKNSTIKKNKTFHRS